MSASLIVWSCATYSTGRFARTAAAEAAAFARSARLVELGDHRQAPVRPVGRKAADGEREHGGGAVAAVAHPQRAECSQRNRYDAHDEERQQREDERAAYDAPRSRGARAARCGAGAGACCVAYSRPRAVRR